MRGYYKMAAEAVVQPRGSHDFSPCFEQRALSLGLPGLFHPQGSIGLKIGRLELRRPGISCPKIETPVLSEGSRSLVMDLPKESPRILADRTARTVFPSGRS